MVADVHYGALALAPFSIPSNSSPGSISTDRLAELLNASIISADEALQRYAESVPPEDAETARWEGRSRHLDWITDGWSPFSLNELTSMLDSDEIGSAALVLPEVLTVRENCGDTLDLEVDRILLKSDEDLMVNADGSLSLSFTVDADVFWALVPDIRIRGGRRGVQR